MMWNDTPLSPSVLNEKEKENQRVEREQAAVKIQKRWWMHMTKRLFKLLKHTIRAAAAVDACKLMGYRTYYNQILQDELQNKRHGITDEIDIATIRDYMQYASHMDETPAYYGGRHNYWRRLTLENWPRAMIAYDIMDYVQSGKLSARLRAELPFLLLKPQNEETCRAQILAVCQIRSMSPGFITTSLSRQEQKAAQRMSQRRSYQARQKIAKMKKVYKAVKEEDLSSPSLSDHSAGDPGPKNQFSNEDWEQEAVMLYDWARSLRTEDIGED
ncbi:putative uncharacterized protein CXorf58 homolog isoform X4 [Crotalus tigris]|uniref:putative uncharacterized protein CXorf58 homolog isoform X4 n=1 Tax=Crotalus tigris TaxID=88082 RepID=UPI00192FA5F9|nr:putative uncharacterized protein CXorf58 homolog isoform X4 [Crotalus tigris]